MRLRWKGRDYRPVGNWVKVYKPSIDELLKPLSEKGKLGSAILTGQFISGIGDNYAPAPSPPQPSPSITPTMTPTPSPTPAGPSLWNTNSTNWENENNTWNQV